MKTKKHKTCKTKLVIERGESPRGYSWWYCPRCKCRVPKQEIIELGDKSK